MNGRKIEIGKSGFVPLHLRYAYIKLNEASDCFIKKFSITFIWIYSFFELKWNKSHGQPSSLPQIEFKNNNLARQAEKYLSRKYENPCA